SRVPPSPHLYFFTSYHHLRDQPSFPTRRSSDLAFVVHAPALQGERIWDDTYLARDNPFIKSPLLILETFRHYLFLDSFSAHYRRSEEHTSELQSLRHLVCRLLLEKKKQLPVPFR